MRYKIVPETITQEMVDEMCYDTDVEMMQPDWTACLAAAPRASKDKALVDYVCAVIQGWFDCDDGYGEKVARAVLKMLEAEHE